MLLFPRTAMTNLVAASAALLANLLWVSAGAAQGTADGLIASARSQSSGVREGQSAHGTPLRPNRPIAQRFAPASSVEMLRAAPRPMVVPRQMLLIDLNPIIDFDAWGEWDDFAQPLGDPALLDVVLDAAPRETAAFSPAPDASRAPSQAIVLNRTTLNQTPARSAPVSPRAASPLPRLASAPPGLANTRANTPASSAASAANGPHVNGPHANGSPLATAAPRAGELPRSAIAARNSRPAQPQPPRWEGPFPSLGLPLLDRQLRRYLAYVEAVGQPDILIVGGQGAVQGVDPLALQASLGDRGHGDLKVFNWGLSDSSAQTVEWLVTELLAPQQLPKLVVWADSSSALNSERQDLAFNKITASTGQRLLARGVSPQFSVQEKTLAQQLRQILRHPIARSLPNEIMALARSPLDWSSTAPVKTHRKPDLSKLERHQNQSPRESRVSFDFAEDPVSRPTMIAQTQPVVIDSRARVLPILAPQKPLPMVSPSRLENNSAHAATGAGASGFRLVNWCRHANGPCQPQDGQSPAALVQPAVPAWLRQAQAAQQASLEARQQAQQRQAASSNDPARQRAATLQARRTQTSYAPTLAPTLPLPTWPQSRASKRFLQAMGFQSVEQQLSARPTGQNDALGGSVLGDRGFSLQGDQNRALHRLVQFGQQQGMAIAFVQLPLSHQSLTGERRRREDAFQTYLDVAAQMTPLHLVELPEGRFAWNNALFAKPDRLNRYGAAALSWQIGQALDRQLLKVLR